jgi:DNA topoisomerase-1
MSTRLVIVESPTKAKTIEKFLGKDFEVLASYGHVRDLPNNAAEIPAEVKKQKWSRLGINVDSDFTPLYIIPSDKEKRVNELKKAVKKASEVYLATDEDREGESISWHLLEVLDPKVPVKRLVFHEITKKAIEESLSNAREIDQNLVRAQETRRIIDRLYGYSVSPLLWKKMVPRLSAGRVQSVAMRLLVQRERERARFRAADYWDLKAIFEAASDRSLPFEGVLTHVDGKRVATGRDFDETTGKLIEKDSIILLDEPAAQHLEKALKLGTPQIAEVESKPFTQRPYAPFTTSTLQQEGSRKLGFGAKRTMAIAQTLYENGFITYMRTDSTNLSREAIEMARGYLEKRHGKAYVPEKPRSYSSSNDSAQEAHEAIRPTDASREPEKIAAALSDEQFKLYRLIWQCFVACQATDAEWDSTSVRLRRTDRDTGAVFKANGRVLRFDGFYKISGTPKDDGEQVLPDFEKGTKLAPFDIEPRQKFQAPPPRYSEATLVKKLEEEGIGRPSTYASIINVIENRGYVEQRDRRFYATALGEAVTGFLKDGFENQFIEIGYTREIEQELDQVAQGKKRWTDVLHEFHDELKPKLDFALEQDHVKGKGEPSPYACPECGRRLEYRLGKSGRFLSCSGYNEKVIEKPAPAPKTTAKGKKRKPAKPKEVPACTFAMPVDRDGKPRQPEQIDLLSPAGVPMVKRTGRFGDFLVEDKPRPPKAKGKKAADAPVEPPPFILNLDRKAAIKFPSPPPLVTDIACPKCGDLMNLRDGKRGPWLGCRAFPKCRGREAFGKLDEKKQKDLKKQLDALLAGQTKLSLTRRDGETSVTEGTPLAALQIEGGVAELPRFEE